MTEPLSDEQIEEIRKRHGVIDAERRACLGLPPMNTIDGVKAHIDRAALLSHVTSLQSRIAELERGVTLTEEGAHEYGQLKPVGAETIIRWWDEDKRRRAQGYRDDNWSRLLLSVLHAFKDLANRDEEIKRLTRAQKETGE